MRKHTLTPAQRANLKWLKQATGPNSHPSTHPGSLDDHYHRTLKVLIREGYVTLDKPKGPSGYSAIRLTKKGEAATTA